MSNFSKFLQFVYPFRRRLLLCMAFTICLTILSLSPPMLLALLTDSIISRGNWDALPIVILLMAFVPMGQSLISGLNHFMISFVGHKLIYQVRYALYRHLQALSLRFFGNMSTGAIMQRIMGDVGTVRSMVTHQTISFITDIVACLFALSMCLLLNWRMALIVMVVLPLYVINYRFFVTRIRDTNLAYRNKMDGICGILQERLSAASMVKSYAREKAETRRFVGDIRQSFNVARESTVYTISFSTFAGLIGGIATSIIYCLGCYMVIHGQMGYGAVIAFMSYTGQLFGPAVRFSEMFNQIEQMKVSLDRIFELMNVQPEITDAADAVSMRQLAGHVQFEHVGFHYLKDEPVLHDINLEIKPGQLVALVGHTGSGKTTIATLLFRFYDVISGRILMDGHDIRNIKLSHLRTNLGVVMQDTILFNDTVRENIRYGHPRATDAEIVAAAKVAEINEVIEALPQGYDTIIGPGGTKLSAGQSQRLAIARAVLTDPAILILDEATSSLDTESEKLIQQALARVMANRTSFVIAHRLSTIANADMIVVLDKGRIVETGKHIDLLRIKGGHYRALCKEQFASDALFHDAPASGVEIKPAKEFARAPVRQTG
ncbi:MAG TPA: ABC transporter ATP-binding protein [Planctomycetota bacterium]|nr:ABC transporter ATP-binding protein [Planctomycetota bacterium]